MMLLLLLFLSSCVTLSSARRMITINPALAYGNETWDFDLNASITGFIPGIDHIITPLDNIDLTVQMWGGGGGNSGHGAGSSSNNDGPGGGGGYTSAITSLLVGTEYIFVVGEGGKIDGSNGGL